MNSDKPSEADLVAEANHLRTQAIKQELESGERMPTVVDDLERQLPGGIQRGRPAFLVDDVEAEQENCSDEE